MTIEEVQLRLELPDTWKEWFTATERRAKMTGLPYSAFYPPNPAIVKKLGPIPKPPKHWQN